MKGNPIESSQLERRLRQTAVGFAFQDDEHIMDAAFAAFKRGDYPAGVIAMMEAVSDGMVAMHFRDWEVLKDAAACYELGTMPIDDAWLLPDRPRLPESPQLFRELLQVVGNKIDEVALAHIEESARCGELEIAARELAAVIVAGAVTLTVPERTALKMVLNDASPEWFRTVPLWPDQPKPTSRRGEKGMEHV